MKKSEMRFALDRLKNRLNIQWVYSQSCVEDDAAAEQLQYSEDGKRIPVRAEVSYYGMIAAFESLGGEWCRNANGTHWLCFDGTAVGVREK